MQITLFIPFVAILFFNRKRWGYALCFTFILVNMGIDYYLTI